jgi:sn-glycerol 3-phosphate transport system permease protein
MEKRATFSMGWLGFAFILPQILLVFTFFYWPTGAAMYWAFTLERPWGGGNEWVGFDNFREVFADRAYWGSIIRSLIFAASTATLSMAFGLLLAVACDRGLKGYQAFRTIFVWPYAVVAPAAALAFRFIFAPETGIFASLVKAYPEFWNPAQNGYHAMAMIIICYSWKYAAYCFIFFLAALQAIPRSVIEASALDGAGVLRRVFDIQLPLITPTFFFMLVISITDSFQDSFGIVDVMTDGGPGKATELLVYKIYFDGFRGLDYSGAAAQSIVLMLIMMVLTFFQFRYIERRVHYS